MWITATGVGGRVGGVGGSLAVIATQVCPVDPIVTALTTMVQLGSSGHRLKITVVCLEI